MEEKPIFFSSSTEFRSWLKKNHDTENVQWVGYYKVHTGKPSMRWEESVREALCFGWIDGIRKSVDDESYKIRFTPRRPDSHWSAKNIRMAEELIKEGRMTTPGLIAYKKLDEKQSRLASYEQEDIKLKKEYEEELRKNKKAWQFFKELAPGYTKQTIHWVMSAKQEKTRRKRLRILIKSSEKGEKIPLLRY